MYILTMENKMVLTEARTLQQQMVPEGMKAATALSGGAYAQTDWVLSDTVGWCTIAFIALQGIIMLHKYIHYLRDRTK